MMDYKEMAEIVTKEVDAILERKKIRAMRIKKVSLAVSGLCAAVIVGVGAWRISSNMKKPDDSFNGSGIISETETTTSANAVTTAKVTTVTTVTAAATETKAAKTTVKATTAITTSEVAKNTSRTNSAVSVAPVKTTASATQQVSTTPKTTTVNTSTSVTSSATVTAPVTTTTQKSTATMPLTAVVTVTSTISGAEISETTTIDSSELFRESTATITIDNNGRSVTYESEHTLLVPEEIGDYIDTVRVDAVFPFGSKWILNLKVYKINDVDTEEAVAVRFANFYDTDDYYLFVNPAYKKEK